MYLECTQTATWINIEKIPLIKLQCQFIGRKGGQWPHTLHNIKVSDSFLGAHWLQRRNTPCDQSQCLCKLGGTNQYVPPTKKHAHQLLGKMAKKKKKGWFQIWGRENTSWTWKNSMFYCALKKVIKESWRHVKTTQLEGALLVKSWQFMNQNDSNGCEPTE